MESVNIIGGTKLYMELLELEKQLFPQAIALAATFDPDLIERTASAISDEARAKYNIFQKKE